MLKLSVENFQNKMNSELNKQQSRNNMIGRKLVMTLIEIKTIVTNILATTLLATGAQNIFKKILTSENRFFTNNMSNKFSLHIMTFRYLFNISIPAFPKPAK